MDASTKESYTYKDLLEKTCTLAENLVENGCTDSTIIGICSENCIEYFIPLITSLYIGCAITFISPNYTEYELNHVLNISKPQIIFCSLSVYQKLLGLKNRLQFIDRIIILESKPSLNNAKTLHNLISVKKFEKFAIAEHSIEKLAFIFYSSGTTGLPKGVMSTHRNMLVRYMHTM